MRHPNYFVLSFFIPVLTDSCFYLFIFIFNLNFWFGCSTVPGFHLHIQHSIKKDLFEAMEISSSQCIWGLQHLTSWPLYWNLRTGNHYLYHQNNLSGREVYKEKKNCMHANKEILKANFLQNYVLFLTFELLKSNLINFYKKILITIY